MGLRLVAHYFDRNEALIVSSVLDAAGIPNFVEGCGQNSIQPFEQIALGGFRLMVRDEDLRAALDVICEARRNPLFEGEQLVQIKYPLLSLALFFVTGAPMPFRTSTWHETGLSTRPSGTH